jgi:hypothetical protein
LDDFGDDALCDWTVQGHIYSSGIVCI